MNTKDSASQKLETGLSRAVSRVYKYLVLHLCHPRLFLGDSTEETALIAFMQKTFQTGSHLSFVKLQAAEGWRRAASWRFLTGLQLAPSQRA